MGGRRGDGEALVRMLDHDDSRRRALAMRLLRDPVLMGVALARISSSLRLIVD